MLKGLGLSKATVDWSICQVFLFQAGSQLQTLEEERLARMSEYLNQYNSHISVLGPRLTQVCPSAYF